MAKKITINGSNLLSDISQDWGGKNNGSSPIIIHGTTIPVGAEWGMNRGEVERFLKAQLGSKAGEFYFDSTTTKTLVFADAADRDLYLSDREEYADLLIGAFDAPANYTAEVTMVTPTSNTILKGATGNYLDFTFDVKSRTGASTGEAVIVTYSFNNSGNIKKVMRIYDAGTSVHFLIDDYLETGTNSVSVIVTGRNTLASAMAAVNFNVVNLELTSSFDFSKPVETGENLEIPYSLYGSGVKYVEWYLDGVAMQSVDTIADLRVNRKKNIDTTGLATGKHSIQVRAYITEGGTNYYSETLYFDFVVCPADEEWLSNTTFVLLGLTLSAPATDGLEITATQYQTFEFAAAIYDSRNRSLPMVITDNSTQVSSITMQPKEVNSDMSYTPTTTGEHEIIFSADGQTAEIDVTAQSGDIDIAEDNDNLLLKLSAKGRTNAETNPAVWSDRGISTTFTGFEWNSQSGWNNGALVIPAGASIDVAIAPLTGNPITNGRTIEIDFETTDITTENASIINISSISTGAGLSVTSNSARLQSGGGAKVETKYRDGDRIHLAFIINKAVGDDARLLYIVNNGKLERASRFAQNDTFSASGNLVIAPTGCAVKVYSIRVYDKPLAVDKAFCNFAVDSPNLIKIATDNDIYDAQTGAISVDKVNAHIPVMIITGDISSIMSINDKSHKNDWNANPVNIEFRNMQNPEMNFFIIDADIRLQGTSSISYPRKNFRIYSKSKSGKYNTKFYTPSYASEYLVSDGKYAFKDGSAPVTCWCLKADFAESSGSHNTGMARLWNEVMKNTTVGGQHVLRTAAQNWAATYDYPYDVRTTIDGFPIVLFQRDSENSPLVCLGQYNFNNDKSTEEVFGFTALTDGEHTFDNSHVECWEVLDSDNAIALFTDVSNFDSGYGDAFEPRYPKSPSTTALKRVATWLNSCKDNQSKWNTEKASYFDLNKLAAYYVYLLRCGAVDQTVKNAMFTTEDGVHWFYINYDNDTILGLDNASYLFDTWDYGLKTLTPNGGYYYAGKGLSVLWNCFEADPECMALVREIDAALFNANFTYEKICEMFDEKQSGQWCERIYNENGRYKYIEQALLGQNVLHMLQGSRTSHRHWWLQHRLEKYDNTWGTGTYTQRSIQCRATGTVNIPQGAAYKFTPAISSNFGYSVASTVVDAPTARTAGTEYTATGLPQATGVGNLIYIYNANNIEKIDVSAYISALGTVDLSTAIDVNGKSNLKKVILGDGENTNAYLTAISGLGVQTGLEELDIRGYSAITSLELSALPNLHKLNALNSGLTSFAPANGSTLTDVKLPASLQTMSMEGNIVNGLTYTPTTTLRYVSLKNISGSWDAKTFVNTWLNALSDAQLENAELVLTGINWTGMTAEQAIAMGKVGTKNYQGKITLSSLTEAQYNQLVSLYGANVFNPSSSFTIDAPAQIFISGPSQVREGSTGTFTATFFPVTEDTVKYLLYNGTILIEAQTDQQGNVYRTYNGVTLYETTGVMSVSSLESDVNVKVRAQVVGTDNYSSYLEVVGKKITYPTAVTISGDATINQNGMYNYTKALSGTYNAEVTNVAWSLSSNNASTLYSSDNNGATVNVTNTPSTSIDVTLTCTVTFEGGVTRTGTKTITMVLTFPTSISISGDDTIADNGDYEYSKTINGSYTATLTGVAWSLTANQNVTIKSSENNGAVLTAPQGNDTAVTLTLTCTCSFSGGITRSGTKNIAVSVFAPPSTEDYVDLDLPSGLLWAKGNIVPDGNAYKVGDETDYGAYFSWGNIVPHFSSNGSTFDDYNFDATNYNSTAGASISFTSNHKNADYSAISGNDAARELLGDSWRMPTATEFQELYNNTDNEWTTINGVGGMKFMKKSDHSVYVFFPATGTGIGTRLHDRGKYGRYWYSSLYSSNNGYSLFFGSSTVTPQDDNYRYYGYSVRAVQDSPKYVDLGLPSGKLWAKGNIIKKGADYQVGDETDYGAYFSWGNIVPHFSSNGSTFDDSYTFDSTTYNSTAGASLSADIPCYDSAHDAALALLGSDWHLPTKEDFQELKNYTDYEWTSIGGIYGYKFMKKSDHSVYVFFPAGGESDGTSLGGRGIFGIYWLSSFYNSDCGYILMFNESNQYISECDMRYIGNSVRAIQDAKRPETVDLGLPSGLKWATGNIVKNGSKYKVGKETNFGAYVSWGNIEPHFSSNCSTFDGSYNFNSKNYSSTAGASVSGNIADNDTAHDAALALLGSHWHLPSKVNIEELYENTDSEWTSINGVYGYKFMKKSDHSVYVFFPAAGSGVNSSILNLNIRGLYWSSNYDTGDKAIYLLFMSSTINSSASQNRYFGFSVRAVK